MPITSTTPTIIDGIEFPYLTINLAISPLIKPNDIGGSIAMKLTPYREKTVEEGGGLEFVEEQSKQVVYLDVFQNVSEGDISLGKVVTTIMTGIQQFITDKGL